MRHSLIFMTALAVGSLFAGHVMAQERTAGSALDNQMTWSGLSSQITTVKQRADGAHIRVDQVEVCGRKQMVYAPGNGADGQGCRQPAMDPNIQTQITNLTNKLNTLTNNYTTSNGCAAKGQVYDGKKCVDTSGGLRWSYSSIQKSDKFNVRTESGDSPRPESNGKNYHNQLMSKLTAAGATSTCPTNPTARLCSDKGDKCYTDIGYVNVGNCNSGNNRESSWTICNYQAQAEVMLCN